MYINVYIYTYIYIYTYLYIYVYIYLSSQVRWCAQPLKTKTLTSVISLPAH